jgi:hypothetical protein|tara:strand:+ start:2014 stop:2505 length:492 start_codon:yes stop_codon:yes gene_type:complete
MSNNNKKYWDQLKKTDPRFTKKVNKGFGEITTIDPMSQIMKMTEVFGPVGEGWNYTCNYNYTTDLVFAEVSVAIQKNNDHFWNYYGPVCSVQKLYRKTGALDDEAPKKAMTDALTKAFSHLGVSADVFLGLHDNSKYVSDLKKEIETKGSIVNKDKVKLVGNN